ncbi:hypothetical protein AOXY_G26038 [Acipenser oxyrinchus oxyrinchus]|uniref:Testis-expressed sequence 12 protein n=1 Tax=Acipenser oxyrinchus oxyrinchus TaxID=40147 RepID=A0AAD8CV57_ACIOX|nr:hypothetical protein AOXY_G26038 [Acipenser oxyrinchus oxyrinchus]
MAGKGTENDGPKTKNSYEVKHLEVECERSIAKGDVVSSDNMTVINFSNAFEAVLEDVNKEINMLLSKYARFLCERAAADASLVHELDEILTEARALETHLTQKKESLRHSLALISNTLQNQMTLS